MIYASDSEIRYSVSHINYVNTNIIYKRDNMTDKIKLENKTVVIKDWGWEEIFADKNCMYRGKVLFINKGKGFHLQRHKSKDETLYIAKGKGILRFNGDAIEVKKGDSFRFKPGDIHKLIAIEDLMIFEVANSIPDSDVEHLE